MVNSGTYTPLVIIKKRKMIEKGNSVSDKVNKVKKVRKVPKKKPVSCQWVQCIEEGNTPATSSSGREAVGETRQGIVDIAPIGPAEKENLWQSCDNYSDYHRKNTLKAKRLARAALLKNKWQAQWEQKLAREAEKKRAREERLRKAAAKKAQFQREQEEIKMLPRELNPIVERPSSDSNSSSDSSTEINENPAASQINYSPLETWIDEASGIHGVVCCGIRIPYYKQCCPQCEKYVWCCPLDEDPVDNSTSDNLVEAVAEPGDIAPSVNFAEVAEDPADNAVHVNAVDVAEDSVNNALSTSDHLEDVLEVIETLSKQPSTISAETTQMNEEDLKGITKAEIYLYEATQLFTKAEGHEDNHDTTESLTQ